jgi:hypothetical protein
MLNNNTKKHSYRISAEGRNNEIFTNFERRGQVYVLLC